jgi:very-short-patch-repair endonuclease
MSITTNFYESFIDQYINSLSVNEYLRLRIKMEVVGSNDYRKHLTDIFIETENDADLKHFSFEWHGNHLNEDDCHEAIKFIKWIHSKLNSYCTTELKLEGKYYHLCHKCGDVGLQYPYASFDGPRSTYSAQKRQSTHSYRPLDFDVRVCQRCFDAVHKMNKKEVRVLGLTRKEKREMIDSLCDHMIALDYSSECSIQSADATRRVDFKKGDIVFEIDGPEHLNHSKVLADKLRDLRHGAEFGLITYRIPHEAIFEDFDGVLELVGALNSRHFG